MHVPHLKLSDDDAGTVDARGRESGAEERADG